MRRQVTLSVLELGSSPTAWANSGRAATDDWVVVAQQSDESSTELSARVLHRAKRLARDQAEIVGLDIYAPLRVERSASAKVWLIRTLIASGALAREAVVTLWFDETETRAAAEVTSAVASHLRPQLRAAGIALAVRFHENTAFRNDEEPSGIHPRPDALDAAPASIAAH